MPDFKPQKDRQQSGRKQKQIQRTQKRSDTTLSPQAIVQRAQTDPQSLTSDDVLQLQRTIGNRATRDLVQRKGFWGRVFDRAFGVSSRKKTRLDTVAPTGYTNTQAENTAVMKRYSRRIKREKLAKKSFIYQNYHNLPSDKRQKGQQPPTAQRVDAGYYMQNPVAWALFRDHCASEFSGENPRFIDFVYDFSRMGKSKTDIQSEITSFEAEVAADDNRQLPQGWNPERESKRIVRPLTVREGIAIYNSFIKAGYAKYEINVGYRTRKAITQQFDGLLLAIKNQNNNQDQANRILGSDPLPRTFLYNLDTAVREILVLMNDSALRFKSTEMGKYAALAMIQNADLDSYANSYSSYMDFYQTEQDRKKNSINGLKEWTIGRK